MKPIKLNFTHNTKKYDLDLMEIFRGFFPYVEIGDDFNLHLESTILENQIIVVAKSNFFQNFYKRYNFKIDTKTELERRRAEKWNIKIALYKILSFFTGVSLPYGSLTGVRPTKLFYEYGDDAEKVFRDTFFVSPNKLALIKKVVDVQKPLLNTKNEYDFFINIPFCPSKCTYCSFVSIPIKKQKNLLNPYVEGLIKEIKNQKKVIKENKIKIRAVYIGGGTPSSLPLNLLEKILKCCNFKQKEFTVEAGRPDTISKSLVRLLKKYKVTRVSVNPQTFNKKTLDTIGRNHKVEDIEKAYNLVKKHFDVNMDLIAMLPNESFEDFKFSVDKAVRLNPENITIHTLYLKKGSALREQRYVETDVEVAKQMVDYANECLVKNNFEPYYMYRQKYTSGNLENVGYAKKGKACLYNIDIMEENTSIMAVGAGAIAKKICKEQKSIKRNDHCKEPKNYIERIDEMIEKNRLFWKQ